MWLRGKGEGEGVGEEKEDAEAVVGGTECTETELIKGRRRHMGFSPAGYSASYGAGPCWGHSTAVVTIRASNK